MDKNEVVEILKELPERIAAVIMPSDRFFDYKGALDFAIKTLEADRWIPVSEQLPETADYVLVPLPKGHGRLIDADNITSITLEDSDLISREALKNYARTVLHEDNATNFSLIKMFDEIIDNAPTVELERSQGEILHEIPKDFVYDTETPEFYCYRNKYTGEEIHIVKSPKTYILARPQGEWVYRQEWFEDEKEPRMAWGCNQCGFSIKSVHEKRNFCPNCGAAMEVKKNETDN